MNRDRTMTADRRIIRFPARTAACVWLTREGPAWLVLAYSNGWLHGTYHTALEDAAWLSENFGLPIRKLNQNTENGSVSEGANNAEMVRP